MIFSFLRIMGRLKSIKTELNKNFKMNDMGEASSILGIRITRDKEKKTISIDQESYINDLLKKFKMDDRNGVMIPLDINQKLNVTMRPQNEQEKTEVGGIPYRQAIGSLLFLSIITRPDISYAVNLLSRFCENPGKIHWGAVKRVFRYLKITSKYKITYGTTNENLVGYCDADWASDIDERRSTTGYLFTINGGAISWSSKRQQTVALSKLMFIRTVSSDFIQS